MNNAGSYDPGTLIRLLAISFLATQVSCRTHKSAAALKAPSRPETPYSADGRAPLPELYSRYAALVDRGWRVDTVYDYPGEDAAPILSWRTARGGEAVWIIAGIHGEEPAGPNAIARSLESVSALADAGVPVVLIPLCNPKGYRNNWRYPNTPERDWRKGGYSVGDAEYLLPDLKSGQAPRAEKPAGPDTRALTAYALRLSESYPPRLVLDLHEDELSAEGGYLYSQGRDAGSDAVSAEIIRLLRSSGIPVRLSGRTRFGEPIEGGVITRDDKGHPIRDGSIDELLASAHAFKNGNKVAGPSARTVIVVETPAFSGSDLAKRIAAHSAILSRIGKLWEISAATP